MTLDLPPSYVIRLQGGVSIEGHKNLISNIEQMALVCR